MRHMTGVWIGLWALSIGILAQTARADALADLSGDNSPLVAGERIVFLGDSITDEGNRPGGYVDLVRQAVSHRRDRRVEVIGAGVSGNKVPDLQARLERDVLKRRPTVVFIFIGINDVWHDPNGTPLNRYEAGLRDVLDQLYRAGAVTVLATPSVIGERWDGTNPHDRKLDAYAAVSRKVAAEYGAGLCDLRAAFIDHLKAHNPDNAPQGILTRDTVHLSEAGNRLVAEQAAAAIERALRDRAASVIIPTRGFVDRTQVEILVRDPAHTRVYYTTDGSAPTERAARYDGPFAIAQTTRVRALGVAPDGRTSTADATFTQATPAAPADGDGLRPGLVYRMARGEYRQMPRFDALPIAGAGVCRGLAFPDGHGEQFAVEYSGYLDVPQTGMYQFTLVSDDGSVLHIGPQRVVDNDGPHAPEAVWGQVALQKGCYPIRIGYFNTGGGATLQLLWARDGAEDQPVPETALRHDPNAAPATQPASDPSAP